MVHSNVTRGERFDDFHFSSIGFFFHHFHPMTDEIFECAHPSATKIQKKKKKKSNLRLNQFPHTLDNNNASTATALKLKAFDRPRKPLLHNNNILPNAFGTRQHSK